MTYYVIRFIFYHILFFSLLLRISKKSFFCLPNTRSSVQVLFWLFVWTVIVEMVWRGQISLRLILGERVSTLLQITTNNEILIHRRMLLRELNQMISFFVRSADFIACMCGNQWADVIRNKKDCDLGAFSMVVALFRLGTAVFAVLCTPKNNN